MSRILRRYVPGHFRQPWRLAGRLLQTRDPAAFAAMSFAALGVAFSPFDLLLSLLESSGRGAVSAETGPLLFICGAPRVGTTLVHQTLVKHLPVSHFTNLTSLFPSAPIAATRLFGRFLGEPVREYRSFYGRTTRLSGLNDALYLWDRWLGHDRLDPAPQMTGEAAREMRQFFVAWRGLTERPLVAKCNRLNAAAATVAEALPKARFICIEREPVWHAQSLLQARTMITGDPRTPYGLTGEVGEIAVDPIASVVEQVQFHRELAEKQEQLVGAERFWRVPYEEFCRNPRELLGRAAEALWPSHERPQLPEEVEPHWVANRRTVDAATFERIEKSLAEAA